MRLKIVGRPPDNSGNYLIAKNSALQVVNADTGEAIQGIYSLTIVANADDLVRASIEFYPVGIELEGVESNAH